LETVMRVDEGALGSRLVFAMPVGLKFTDNPGLAEACIKLGPRYRSSSGQNHPRYDVDH
jgi:hypothetical protein